MGNSKWVHMMFAVGGLLLFYITTQMIDWIWGYFDTPKDLYVVALAGVIAGSVTLYTWRKDTVFEKAGEITNELSKVTWPTRKETVSATWVVIITTIVSSFFLGMFDVIWSWATALIYT